MPSMPAGNHPNLIYSSSSDGSDASDNTTLLRYDVTTATTTTLIKRGFSLWAISPDRQWMSLIIKVQNQSAIQLLRMDGQQVQTLYCASKNFSTLLFSPDQHFLVFVQSPPQDPSAKNFDPVVDTLGLLDLTTGKVQTLYSGPGIDNLLFSPDQRSLAFIEGDDPQWRGGLTMDILDLTTGKLHAVLSSQQPGFPALISWQPPAIGSSFFSLHEPRINYVSARRPLSSGNWNALIPLRWAGHNGLFISIGSMGSPGSYIRLYLLHDISQNVSTQQSNLQYILDNSDWCTQNVFDLTPDSQQIVCSNSSAIGPLPTPATIATRPVAGGNPQTIYRGPIGSVRIMSISGTTLLFTQFQAEHPETVWKVNIDGSTLTQLLAAPSADWDITQPIFLDDALYALTMHHDVGNSDETAMVVGSLTGSSTKTIVKTRVGSLTLMGWAQL